MAKKNTAKKTAKPTMEEIINNTAGPIEEVAEIEVEVEEPEYINTLSWKEVQEKYGVLTDEIMDINSDLSKYKMKPEDEAVLRNYVKKVYKSVADITLDKTHMPIQIRKIFDFYWLTLAQIQEGRLDKLTDEEKEEIEKYYEKLFAENARLVKRF